MDTVHVQKIKNWRKKLKSKLYSSSQLVEDPFTIQCGEKTCKNPFRQWCGPSIQKKISLMLPGLSSLLSDAIFLFWHPGWVQWSPDMCRYQLWATVGIKIYKQMMRMRMTKENLPPGQCLELVNELSCCFIRANRLVRTQHFQFQSQFWRSWRIFPMFYSIRGVDVIHRWKDKSFGLLNIADPFF